MKPDESSVNKAKELIASVLGGDGTVSSTSQTPEKTEVHTPTTDPNAAVSVPEESADSVILEAPAESVPEQPEEQPAEQPAETTPAEPETPATQPAEGETEAPSISLPSQEELEQSASSLYGAASTILDALLGSSSNNEKA